MWAKVQDFFTIPSEIMPEFWRTALSRNRVSLLVICVMIFGMELFNMARVLFWSNSGLGTLNNRIYFGFYLSLFLAAAICLILGCVFRIQRLAVSQFIQYGSVLFFLWWHVHLQGQQARKKINCGHPRRTTAHRDVQPLSAARLKVRHIPQYARKYTRNNCQYGGVEGYGNGGHGGRGVGQRARAVQKIM